MRKKNIKYYLLLPILFLFALVFSCVNLYAEEVASLTDETTEDNYYGGGVNLPDPSMYTVPWDTSIYGVKWSKAKVNYFIYRHEYHKEDTNVYLENVFIPFNFGQFAPYWEDFYCFGDNTLIYTTITDEAGNPINTVTRIEYEYSIDKCKVGNNDTHVCRGDGHHQVNKVVNELTENTKLDTDGTFISSDFVNGWNGQIKGINVPLISGESKDGQNCNAYPNTSDKLSMMFQWRERIQHIEGNCSINKTNNKNNFCNIDEASNIANNCNYMLVFPDYCIEDLLYLNVWYLSPALDINGDKILNEDGSVQMEELGGSFNDTGAHPIFDEEGTCAGIFDAEGNLLNGYSITTNGNPFYTNENGEVIYTIDRETQIVHKTTIVKDDGPSFKNPFEPIGDFISDVGSNVGNFFGDTFENIGNVVGGIGNAIGGAFNFVASLPSILSWVIYIGLGGLLIWLVMKIIKKITNKD